MEKKCEDLWIAQILTNNFTWYKGSKEKYTNFPVRRNITIYYSLVSDWESQIVWTNGRKARVRIPLEKGRHIKPGKDTRNCDIKCLTNIHIHITKRSHCSHWLIYLSFGVMREEPSLEMSTLWSELGRYFCIILYRFIIVCNSMLHCL